jgi:alpha-L-rhamnosidase
MPPSGRLLSKIVIPGLMFVAVINASASSRIAPPTDLTCDYQTSALAITSSRPMLAWKISAANNWLRGVRQTGWRILASTTLEKLTRNQGDLWDSGRVSSSRTLGIAYDGQTLVPEQIVFWRVEVWDDQGNPSGWSAPESFMIAPARWSAQWIGAASENGAVTGKMRASVAPCRSFAESFRSINPCNGQFST